VQRGAIWVQSFGLKSADPRQFFPCLPENKMGPIEIKSEEKDSYQNFFPIIYTNCTQPEGKGKKLPEFISCSNNT
jgi:hypothetical protein